MSTPPRGLLYGLALFLIALVLGIAAPVAFSLYKHAPSSEARSREVLARLYAGRTFVVVCGPYVRPDGAVVCTATSPGVAPVRLACTLLGCVPLRWATAQ